MAEQKAGFHRISGLDQWRSPEQGHTNSPGGRPGAKRLRDRFGLSSRWGQAVTIRYGWERGLRT